MNGRMKRLDSLLPQVMPQLNGCPVSMARDALQFIAGDFCKISGTWRMQVLELVPKGETVVPFHDIPKGARISEILQVAIEGTLLPATGAYTVGIDGITLKTAPQKDVELVANVTLRPVRTAEEIPEEILEEWGDIIAIGALAKLKAMSGAHIMWSDMQGAQTNLSLYNEGIYAARTRAFRNSRGGGVLFMTKG